MSDSNQNQTRPTVMEDLTDSQLRELELQFDENDQDEFVEFTKVYGWSDDDSQAVWDWLSAGNKLSGFEDA